MTQVQEAKGSAAPVTVDEICSAIHLFQRLKAESFQGMAEVGPLDEEDEDRAFEIMAETRERVNEMIRFLQEKVDEISGT